MISPPTDLIDTPANETGQLILVVACFGLAFVALMATFMVGRRKKDWRPLVFVSVGGLFTSFGEPLWDHNYHLWFFVPKQWIAYTAYGVSIPIWVPPAHVWFYGGLGYVFYRLVSEGRSQKTLLQFSVVVFILAGIFDLAANLFDVMEYYGYHPLTLHGSPVWIAPLNVPVAGLAGIAFARLPAMHGRRIILNALFIPTAFGAVWFGFSLPSLAALNLAETSTSFIWLGAFAHIAIALAALWAATLGLTDSTDDVRVAPPMAVPA